ncbi:GNAT family N-acetyltransferase [Gluconobacter thailandicus]|uniref:GNAT family N-acetyltransferase n=2 Tax=Gluconobacter thailandicus TaxID=257438 RepID=UPI00037C5590|nr:GNAT family N-acetyltransferase [Gluconobacter thailandicus]
MVAMGIQCIPVFETERLLLVPLRLLDAPSIQTKFPRWEIVKFMNANIPWPYPGDGALTFLRDFAIPAMEKGVEWHWSLRLKENSDELIGVISLHDYPDDNRGFWLCPEWQGRGLMTEACNAVTDFWFNKLNRKLLRAPKASQNLASRRISVCSGMRLVWTGERDYVCGRERGEIWEITAEEWNARI